MKKLLKVLAVIAVIAGVIAVVSKCLKKISAKKQQTGNTEENYVSCSCNDQDFSSETVA